MRAIAIAFGLTVFAAACAGTDSDPDEGANDSDIRNGVMANDEKSEVGLFVFPLSGGAQGHCTATLIGPRTAITAAHCVLPSSGPGPCDQGSVYLDTAGEGAALSARVKIAVRACATPISDVRSLSVRGKDIAVLALARKVTEVTQMATIATAVPSSTATMTVFGYGRVGADCTQKNTYQKYRVSVTFGATGSLTCKGDSGGPYFVGSGSALTNQIVSLVSGETTSAGNRVMADLVSNRDWISARRGESEGGGSLRDSR